MESQLASYVGIDVSQKQLDVHVCPQNEKKTFANEGDFKPLIEYLKGYAPRRVVLESTGGLEKSVARALRLAESPVVTVNAKQIRGFAIAIGVQAKTDTIDASVIALFAQRVQKIE